MIRNERTPRPHDYIGYMTVTRYESWDDAYTALALGPATAHDCPMHGDITHHPDRIDCQTCGREWHYTERDWPPPPQQHQPARSQEGWHNCIPECDCLASTTCTERR